MPSWTRGSRIIDDNSEFAANLALLLEAEGHIVSARDRDAPDMLILDVMFPENPAGGFDLARAIRRTLKRAVEATVAPVLSAFLAVC